MTKIKATLCRVALKREIVDMGETITSFLVSWLHALIRAHTLFSDVANRYVSNSNHGCLVVIFFRLYSQMKETTEPLWLLIVECDFRCILRHVVDSWKILNCCCRFGVCVDM